MVILLKQNVSCFIFVNTEVRVHGIITYFWQAIFAAGYIRIFVQNLAEYHEANRHLIINIASQRKIVPEP